MFLWKTKKEMERDVGAGRLKRNERAVEPPLLSPRRRLSLPFPPLTTSPRSASRRASSYHRRTASLTTALSGAVSGRAAAEVGAAAPAAGVAAAAGAAAPPPFAGVVVALLAMVLVLVRLSSRGSRRRCPAWAACMHKGDARDGKAEVRQRRSILFRLATARKNKNMVASTSLPASSLPAYRLAAAVEPFYAGGALTLLPDGRVACACGDEVKVKN